MRWLWPTRRYAPRWLSIKDLTTRQRRRQLEKSGSRFVVWRWRSRQNWDHDFMGKNANTLANTIVVLYVNKRFLKPCRSFVTLFSCLMLPVWLILMNSCVLLYDVNKPKNSDLHYTNYDHFDLDKMTDDAKNIKQEQNNNFPLENWTGY